MHIIKDTHWAKLPFSDFRGRFFVETCYELLHTETPPFHQSRLMNVISSTKEVLITIKDYRYDEKNVHNLRNSTEELKLCLHADTIAQKIYRKEIENLENVFKHINPEDKIHYDVLRRLELLCKNILAGESSYFESLTENLKEIITDSGIDLSQKHRITKTIYHLTGLYISYLLSNNYSPKYLYNRTEYFTRQNNYKNRNFEEQFDHVLSILNSRIDTYTVCFAFHTRHLHKLTSHPSILNATLRTDIADLFDKQNINKLNPDNTYNIYALIDVETTDYISASFKAKEKLDVLIDLMNFHDLLHSRDIKDTCLTKVKIDTKTYIKEVKLGTLLSFVTVTSTKEYYKYFDFMLDLNNRLEVNSSDRLKRSLHYLRLSKDTNSLEQKLLNIWIALESLFDSQGNTIIGNISSWLPQVYATSSVRDRLNYLLDLLIKYKVQIPTDVKEKYQLEINHFTQDVSLSVFCTIFYDKESINKVFSTITEKEFLKFRMYSTFLELKNPKKVLSRINKTSIDVDRQLKRIYVLRNKLTHQAQRGTVKGQIVNHLFEYTMMCYHAIFTTLENSQDTRKLTIDDTLLAYQMGCEYIHTQLKKASEDSTIDFPMVNIKPII